ncbi:hypothetical protein PENSPDRAFT_749262 [Peniophora sp. CONT]|nr:hypothetical protein PENSPDRAFT_749262 [Peniophora sp. CONT]
MDSLRLNQLLQQDAYAHRAGGEPKGSAAPAASSGVIYGDDAGNFWGQEGFPLEGPTAGGDGGVMHGEIGGSFKNEPQDAFVAGSATSPRTMRYLGLTNNNMGGAHGTFDADPLVVPHHPLDPAQLPTAKVECEANALGFAPNGAVNYTGLQTPMTHKTAALHDFGATPATGVVGNDFGDGSYVRRDLAQSLYDTPVSGNFGNFDLPAVPLDSNWYYGAQTMANMPPAPSMAYTYQQVNTGFGYTAQSGNCNGGAFTHQVQATALPQAGYGVWPQGQGSFFQGQAQMGHPIEQVAGPSYNTVDNGSWASAEAQHLTSTRSANPWAQDSLAPAGPQTQAHPDAKPKPKPKPKPKTATQSRKTAKKATGKVKSSLSQTVTDLRPMPVPPAKVRVGGKARARLPCTIVPFNERETTTIPNAVVSYDDALLHDYKVEGKLSTLPRIKCPIASCHERFGNLQTCERHVDYFAAMYVQEQTYDSAHFDVQSSVEFIEKRSRKMKGTEVTALPCDYPGCGRVLSRADALLRHRRICEFKTPTFWLPTVPQSEHASASEEH